MKRILALAIAVTLVKSTCLAPEVLKSIGFDATQDVATVKSPSVCTDLFKISGTCVPEAAVKAKMKADNSDLSDNTSILIDMFTNIAELNGLLTEVAGSSKDDVENLKTTVKESQAKCVNAWNVIQQGITCYLASGDASSNTTVSTNVQISLNSTTVGPLLTNCLPVLVALCSFTAGVSFDTSEDASISGNPLYQSNTELLKEPCSTLKTNYNCSTDSCIQAQYDIIINSFFAPYEYSIFPSATVAAQLNTAITTAQDNLKLLLNSTSRRLASSTSVKAKSNSTGGADAKTYGENSGYNKLSGVEIVEYAVSILVTAFVILVR